ncbi:MAG TPA: aldehyde ferredoxin oxidoreductase C-terminal domain-containing protein, partial [Smithellaceae bacterium]|nr:aldehyde ferredoxin oxidoreductase C-terminal domain-containing protein [Smithellaceae bacterium]
KLPWVDVFNPDSEKRRDTDIYINPASQELYADFYNAVLGTSMTWEEIFAQTDRDINLQRVMNVLILGRETAAQDWIPDRAIAPTDDELYNAERDFNDQEVTRITKLTPEEFQSLSTETKREVLMNYRKDELKKLIAVYYEERGWNSSGIPKAETLKQIGLWDFLNDDARAAIAALTLSAPAAQKKAAVCDCNSLPREIRK